MTSRSSTAKTSLVLLVALVLTPSVRSWGMDRKSMFRDCFNCIRQMESQAQNAMNKNIDYNQMKGMMGRLKQMEGNCKSGWWLNKPKKCNDAIGAIVYHADRCPSYQQYSNRGWDKGWFGDLVNQMNRLKRYCR